MPTPTVDSKRLTFMAACLAKMQREGPCSRDFLLDCYEPFKAEHLTWAQEVLSSLDHLASSEPRHQPTP